MVHVMVLWFPTSVWLKAGVMNIGLANALKTIGLKNALKKKKKRLLAQSHIPMQSL